MYTTKKKQRHCVTIMEPNDGYQATKSIETWLLLTLIVLIIDTSQRGHITTSRETEDKSQVTTKSIKIYW